MDVLRARPAPERRDHEADALENAIAAVAMSGGSTNGVLHLLAVATRDGRAAVDRRVRRDQRAHAAAVRPAARRPVRRDRPLRRRRRAARAQAPAARPASCTRDAITVTGRTIGEHADAAQRDAGPARSCARSTIRSSRPAASRSCAATSRRTAASSSSPATSAATTSARRACSTARRRRWPPCSRKQIAGRRRRRDPQRGPGRRPGHARDARGHGGDRRARGWARASR